MRVVKIDKSKKYYPFETNWVVGTFCNRGITYRFNAKVFYEPSIWGINDGNVSKLWVKNLKLDKEVFDFDRGFNIGNQSMVDKGMIKNLVDFLNLYAVEIMEKTHTDPSYFEDWEEA